MSKFDKPDDEQKGILQFPADRIGKATIERPKESSIAERDRQVASFAEARERAQKIREQLETTTEEAPSLIEPLPLQENIFQRGLIDGMIEAGISEEKAHEVFDTAAITTRALEEGVARRGESEPYSKNHEEKAAQYQRDWDAALAKYQEQYPRARKTWFPPIETAHAILSSPIQRNTLTPGARFFNFIYDEVFLRGAKAFVTFLDRLNINRKK